VLGERFLALKTSRDNFLAPTFPVGIFQGAGV
jgi:hypothetical protein